MTSLLLVPDVLPMPVLGGTLLFVVLLLLVVLGVLVHLHRRYRRLPATMGFLQRGGLPLVLLVVGGILEWLYAPQGQTTQTLLHMLVIVAGAWVLGALAFTVEEVLLRRQNLDVPDNLQARRITTQVSIARRTTTGLLVLGATTVILLQFESVRAVGAGLIASAGVLSIIVGLAAQTTLGNIFASIQLAFTDALRVDDVVVVEGEWGNVEALGLSVVVRIWDSRRLILPSTYFTQQPFENWTRHEAAVLGSVEMDIDWNAPVHLLREEFQHMIQRSDLWDGKVAVFQVIDAIGSFVRVRALVSAQDGPRLFDLRCAVREHLVTWLRSEHPEGLPRVRTSTAAEPRKRPPIIEGQEQEGARMFSGSPQAEARASDLTGAIPVVRG